MAIVSRAEAVWNGDLASGSGVVSAASSGAFTSLPVSWSSRTESHEDRTSPEELVAAAHASCYAMAFSHGLTGSGHPPDHLNVSAEVTFEQVEGGWKVASSALSVEGRVPGIDATSFQKAANDAKDGCPISKALAGNVAITVDASLVG